MSRKPAIKLSSCRVVVVDNYDSFTYNLVQYFGEFTPHLTVVRNDQVLAGDIENLSPTHLVISPGPGNPDEAGISKEVILRYSGVYPLLGVCLGHQCIGEVFGGRVGLAKTLMHGKTSLIHHDGAGVFAGLSNPMEATRYHSLAVSRKGLPKVLRVTAHTEDGEIMGLQHLSHPTFGVQFHPESVLTHHGKKLIKNFLMLSD